MAARVYNGEQWTDVLENSESGNTGNQSPVKPVLNGNEKIFVSIAQFRGT